jgi:hypothetical protein
VLSGVYKDPRPCLVSIRSSERFKSADFTLFRGILFFGSIGNGIFFEHLVVGHDLLGQGTGGWMLEVQSEELVKVGVALLLIFSSLHQQIQVVQLLHKLCFWSFLRFVLLENLNYLSIIFVVCQIV